MISKIEMHAVSCAAVMLILPLFSFVNFYSSYAVELTQGVLATAGIILYLKSKGHIK